MRFEGDKTWGVYKNFLKKRWGGSFSKLDCTHCTQTIFFVDTKTIRRMRITRIASKRLVNHDFLNFPCDRISLSRRRRFLYAQSRRRSRDAAGSRLRRRHHTPSAPLPLPHGCMMVFCLFGFFFFAINPDYSRTGPIAFM